MAWFSWPVWCITKTFALEMPSHWISVYRKSTISTMHEYGSYFLWHLKTEGIVLFSKTGFLEEKLRTLPEYTKIEDDLADYLTICRDIRNSISQDFSTASYELAVIASLLRNTCIAYAYLRGKHLFGRVAPVEYCLNIIGSEISFSIKQYEELYLFRIAYTRGNQGITLPQPTLKLVTQWLDVVEKLIHSALRYKGGA